MLLATLCAGLMLRGAAAAEVTDLPGLEGNLTSRMFSGYLQASANHYLFYVLVESKSEPATDPLLIWTNGGPGCSSMLGFFTEHGPYLVMNTPGKLVSNQYSWNAAANYLYIEHPIGVGFSYSTHSSDYAELNDDSEADELYNGLLDFYSQFPEFKERDLYLTGESYAGQYVPHLAHRIAHGANAQLANSLRGFAVGNPVFDCESYNHDGSWATMTLNMLYYTGLIPYAGPYASFMTLGCGEPATMTNKCWTHFNKAYNLAGSWSQGLAEAQVQRIGDSDQQLGGRSTAPSQRRSQSSIQRNRRMDRLRARFGNPRTSEDESQQHGKHASHGRRAGSMGAAANTLDPSSESEPPSAHSMVAVAANTNATARLDDEPDYDPDNKYGSFCTGNSSLDHAVLPNANGDRCLPLGSHLEQWLNRSDVQWALHVAHAPLGGAWTECASAHGWSYETSGTNVVKAYYEPLFQKLNASRFRVLVYSGIEDIGVVTPAETQQCVAELHSSAVGNHTRQWGPWRRDGTPLGYWEASERLTFATIKGAGHMAPTNQPVASAQMLYRWLHHNDLEHPVREGLFVE